MTILAGVPLKGFDEAKGRLASTLSLPARTDLARATAMRVVEAARGAGLDVVVVTGSEQVRAWAADAGVRVLDDPPGGGLDGAAALVASAGDRWCVIHGDLPLIRPSDLVPLFGLVGEGRAVLAPSRDGGTNLFAGVGPMRFSYGPGSFGRHLRAASHLRPAVLVTPGLAVELDTIADLDGAARLADGSWLAPFIEGRRMGATTARDPIA